MQENDRREQDLENALRHQEFEHRLTALEQNLSKNTAATEKLLAAWESSNATVAFIKGCAIFAAAVVATVTGITKLWGH